MRIAARSVGIGMQVDPGGAVKHITRVEVRGLEIGSQLGDHSIIHRLRLLEQQMSVIAIYPCNAAKPAFEEGHWWGTIVEQRIDPHQIAV